VTHFALQAVQLSARAGRYDEIYANLPKLKIDGSLSLKQFVLPKLTEHLLASGQVEEGRRTRNTLLTDAFFASFKPDEGYLRESYAQFMAWIAEDEPQFVKALGLMNEKLSPEVLNLLPADKLQSLADQSVFSAEQKALLRRVAFVRRLAVGKQSLTAGTDAAFKDDAFLAKTSERVAADYPKLKSQHARLLTILRNPRFGVLVNSPDDYTTPIETIDGDPASLAEFDANDRNWWCPLQTDRHLATLRREYDAAAGMVEAQISNVKSSNTALSPVLEADAVTKADAAREAVFKQHPMIKAVNWKDVERLAKAPSGPKFLTQAALKWAKAAKGDPAAAEALALAVRSTRYGCRWAGSHEAYSKPAQELLKAKYPTSDWTKETPYWFGCMDQVYDAQYNKVTSCKARTWKAQPLPK
jgi:hypothetical protein